MIAQRQTTDMMGMTEMVDDDHIDKLARGVMACHKKGITLDAVQEAVKTFWDVADAMRPPKDKETQ